MYVHLKNKSKKIANIEKNDITASTNNYRCKKYKLLSTVKRT